MIVIKGFTSLFTSQKNTLRHTDTPKGKMVESGERIKIRKLTKKPKKYSDGPKLEIYKDREVHFQ